MYLLTHENQINGTNSLFITEIGSDEEISVIIHNYYSYNCSSLTEYKNAVFTRLSGETLNKYNIKVKRNYFWFYQDIENYLKSTDKYVLFVQVSTLDKKILLESIILDEVVDNAAISNFIRQRILDDLLLNL